LEYSFPGIDREVQFFREMTAAFAFYRTLWEASTASENEKNHILPFILINYPTFFSAIKEQNYILKLNV